MAQGRNEPQKNSSEDLISSEQMLKRFRIIMLIYGTLYPLWGPVLYALVPNAYDSLPLRFALGGSMFAFVGLSYRFRWVQKNLDKICYTILTIAYVHVYEMIWQNNIHLAYAFGGFVIIIMESICFINLRALTYYFATVVTTITIGTLLRPDMPTIMFGFASLSIVPVCYWSVQTLLKMMFRVKQSKEELLDLSAAVQSLFLPTDKLVMTDVFDMHGYYRAVDKCGGDWWKLTQFENNRIRVSLGDVMGHGPGSAMMTASVASYFKILESDPDKDSGEILKNVNDQMTDFGKTQSTYLMTMLVLDIDFQLGYLRAQFAGAPAPAIINSKGEVRYPIQAGTPLGTVDFQVGKVEFEIQQGDRLLLFTDGIIEAEKNNIQFGQRRLSKLIQDTKTFEGRQAVESIMESIDKFVGENPQNDDYTLIVLDIKKILKTAMVKSA